MLDHLDWRLGRNFNQNKCTGCSSSTCHSERPSQAQSTLLAVGLLQVHPAHSHYLTDQKNLFSAQVLVPQVLVDKNQGKENRETRKQTKRGIGSGDKRYKDEKMEERGVGGQKVSWKERKNNAIFLNGINPFIPIWCRGCSAQKQ